MKRIVWVSLALIIMTLPVCGQKTPEQLEASLTAHHSDYLRSFAHSLIRSFESANERISESAT